MIKSAVKNDAGILAELAIQMWHDSTVLDLEKEFKNNSYNEKCNVSRNNIYKRVRGDWF